MFFLATLLFSAGVVTNFAELAATDTPELRFELTGVVSFSSKRFGDCLAMEGPSGAVCLFNETTNSPLAPAPGDLVHARGWTDIGSNGRIRRNCKRIEILGHEDAPAPVDATLAELSDGRSDNRLVRVRCTLRDIHVDEIDKGNIFLSLADGNDSLYLTIQHTADSERRYRSLIGARLEITGICIQATLGSRLWSGRKLCISGPDAIRVVDSAGEDQFDVPSILDLANLQPSRIACHGRCRAIGTVLAVWQNGERVLIENHGGIRTELRLAEPRPPRCGDVIEAVGLPASNLFRINLIRAMWRPAMGTPVKQPMPIATTARDLLTGDGGRPQFNAARYGQPIRLKGVVKALSTAESHEGRIYLASDIFTVPIDVSSVPDAMGLVDAGYEIEATGICILDSENWTPYTAFPQINGMTLVLRAPDDIDILSRPPWWTPRRLLLALAIAFAALLSILCWNLLLRKAVRRRERELKKEIFARVESNSKVRERTRLAVELHDSLSQGLTGVSMEIDTAANLANDPAAQAKHLAYASKSLKSCRAELTNCIWDLRNDSLDEVEIDEAIRRTLIPLGNAAAFSVRVNVPRERLSDNTTHAILRIVRELATNALRHGQASRIRVAGCLEGGMFYLSVRDNGRGFDPQRCPGLSEGHFGLQGIRERVKKYNGTFDIASSPGHGTHATLSFHLVDENDERDDP